MKKLFPKILSLFGASVFLFPVKEQNLSLFLDNSKQNITNAKIENLDTKEKKTLELDSFIKELNQTEIFLLVTKPLKYKKDKNHLVLLQPNDRRPGNEAILNHSRSHLYFDKGFLYFDVLLSRILAHTRIHDSLDWKEFRDRKIYYPDSIGGYKSISPIFFNKETAEDFLIHSMETFFNSLEETEEINSKEKEKFQKYYLQKSLQAKIISVGLGDFIQYYSEEDNKQVLEQVEFLFFPLMEELKAGQQSDRKVMKLIKNTTFQDYQEKYYDLKSEL